jgi:DeoR family glycerol-3-phosphate regulon repressor
MTSDIAAPAAPGMTQTARLSAILTLLEARPNWAIAELAGHFQVSEETIRRDVRQLEQMGRVRKVHGGVSLPSSNLEGPYRLRMRRQAEGKMLLSRKAAELVHEGMTLFLDAGTTTFWMARALSSLRDLTIITNSIDIAQEVVDRPGQRIFFAGGTIHPGYHGAFGLEAISYCRSFVPDMTVLSVGAVEAERGFMDFDVDEASFKRAIIPHARRIMILADAAKFTLSGVMHFAGYEDVHDLVTDKPLPTDICKVAEAAGIQVHVGDLEAGSD